MILDVMRASITVTQPLLALTDQQLLHEVPHHEVGGGGPGDPAEEDVLVEREPVPGEGRVSGEKLVGEYPQPPPVNTLVVTSLQDDLRRHVVRGPAHRPAPLLLVHQAGEAQVSEDDVTLRVQQDVLRLQVSVDDVVPVEVGEGGDDLGDVEDRGLQGELPVALEIGEELSSADLHEEGVGSDRSDDVKLLT